MTISQKFREFVLKILKANEWANRYTIQRQFTFQGNAAKNNLWYEGDSYELQQFYQQTDNDTGMFWGSVSSPGQSIRRIHTGLPQLVVDSLVNVTAKDMEGVTFKDEKQSELWEQITKNNNFVDILAELTKTALVIGDGAVKFSYDLDESKTPYIDIVPGDCVDFVYKRHKLHEVKFYSYYNVHDVDYTLEEIYGWGYIHYKLYKGENEVSVKTILQTSDLEDVEFDKNIMLAVPFQFSKSTKYQNRGKSIYDGKIDAFDAVDECMSQWMDALRSGRTKTYIPESLIPRDASNGALMRPNAFDNRFIQIGDDMRENASNNINTQQGAIQTDAYIQTYLTVLEIAIQGIISPATLGIDTKKIVDPNAAYSREMEKCTLYTRASIVENLSKIAKNIIQTAFNTMSIMYNTPIVEVDADVSFGEYANPSFEAIVQVMSNPNTPMSIESKVEELWGDTKDEDWKNQEIQRIKTERGLVEVGMPSLGQL